jgi:tRNA-Thr(GGU) m(6)t(6)A37 methyltransferase TsaA
MSESNEKMPPVTFTPIGVIHSIHQIPEETPVQPACAQGIPGQAEIRPEYVEGLKDLDGYSHLILLYHLHRAGSMQLTVHPFTDDKPHGLFSTRHPRRPNPIGLSIVRLLRIEGHILKLENVDILDGTPLLDIKPFVPRYDIITEPRGGWTETVDDEVAAQRGLRGFRQGGAS